MPPRRELGPDRIEQLLEQGAASERSDLYRTMWDHLQPAFEASAAD